ncbi:MAG TPA: hypothetical protein PLB69_04270, partial [Smithellaceae bacterium]|nr:hypothetical protein [Smithellaceae bacterium]
VTVDEQAAAFQKTGEIKHLSPVFWKAAACSSTVTNHAFFKTFFQGSKEKGVLKTLYGQKQISSNNGRSNSSYLILL